MLIESGDLSTKWREIYIALRPDDIERLINKLEMLQANPHPHFHITSNSNLVAHVVDIEVSVQGQGEVDNAAMAGGYIEPNR